MAQIVLIVPDAEAPRVLEAFANRFGWTAALGVTKVEFLRQQLIAYVKGQVHAYEGERDRAAALAAVPDVPAPDVT